MKKMKSTNYDTENIERSSVSLLHGAERRFKNMPSLGDVLDFAK
jgi:hypothetical protein